MVYYNIKGKKIKNKKLLKKISIILEIIEKQGFYSISDYGKFYGYKNGLEVIQYFKI